MKVRPLQREKTITGNRLLVFRNSAIEGKPVAIEVFAVIPPQMDYSGDMRDNVYDGKEAQLHDWKITMANGASKLEVGAKARIWMRGAIYMGNGNWREFNGNFVCEVTQRDLPQPGRNFEWSEFSRCWINRKTGQRISTP